MDGLVRFVLKSIIDIELKSLTGSFLEFLPIIDRLRESYKASELPYHVVVPSLPGWTFSSPPPLDKDFYIQDIARIINKLAVGLGFDDGYVVQGGDIGSAVARNLGTVYPSCKGSSSSLFSFVQLTQYFQRFTVSL